jgi:hypothetical protein
MSIKEKAYKTLEKLIEHFDDHIDTYKKGYYNETQARVDYINPFFKALGRDIDNEQGLAKHKTGNSAHATPKNHLPF